MSHRLEAALDEARERLLDQVFAASTGEEIAAAREALRRWMHEHPEERGMRDGFEALSHRQDYLEAQPREEAQEMAPPLGRESLREAVA